MICCRCHKEISKTYGRVTDLGNYCKECAKQNEVEATYETNMKSVLEIEKKNAVKEFAEKLKKKVHNYYPSIDSYCMSRHVILVKDIDELLKEYDSGK